jgi:Ca2+-binding EF-hand superfamily protein
MTTAFDRLNHVEEIMLAKVQQRTPQRMNEDTFLMKAFRYYDLGGTGFINFDMFEKAVSPFSGGIAYEDLTAIFQRYASCNSPSQPALNYKVFAVEFVSGERRRFDLAPPEGDVGDGLDESCNETFLRLRDCLYNHGPRVVMSLAAAFREADPQNTRCLSYEAFHDVMTSDFANENCPLHEDQIDMLFDALRQTYNPEELAYDELFLALQVEQSQERRDVVRAAFRRLDTTSEGLVDMAHVVHSYNVSRHPQVSDGSKSAEEMLNEFADTLSDAVAFRRGQRSYPTNVVAWEEFEDYYKLVNGCFATDATFCSTLQKVWDLDKMPNMAIDARAVLARPAAGVPVKNRVGLHHWQANTLPSNVTHHNVDNCINVADVLHRVRRQVAQNG